MLKAPFAGPPTELTKTEQRFAGSSWGEKDGLALVSDFDRDRRWVRTFLLSADKPGETPKLVWSRSIQDRYGDPGSPGTRLVPDGGRAGLQRGDGVFLIGARASEAGDRPV